MGCVSLGRHMQRKISFWIIKNMARGNISGDFQGNKEYSSNHAFEEPNGTSQFEMELRVPPSFETFNMAHLRSLYERNFSPSIRVGSEPRQTIQRGGPTM